MFDSLATLDFLTLQKDSLNETREGTIYDDVNYKFQIETLNGTKVVESYAPQYFLSEFPDMKQRVIFLKGKDMFVQWWKKYCR